MEKISIMVSNVKCNGCVSAIKDNLMMLPGISEVDVDVTNGKITIERAELLQTDIIEKLNELGYPLI
ncbi:MAG: heavy-metal-associated domain-containing protein [Gammaproteobacteria bacterium]